MEVELHADKLMPHLVGCLAVPGSSAAACLPLVLQAESRRQVPHHWTFSANREGRQSEILRHIFQRVVAACMAAGLVKGEGARWYRRQERPTLF